MKCEARLIALTQPTIELREATPEGVVAYCARVSNPQHQDKLVGSLFDYCIRNKHWSIFQMCNAVIELEAPRDITRQFTRHSSMYTLGDPFEAPGFNLEYGGVQEFSQRYSDEIEFTDRDFRRQDEKNRQNSIDDLRKDYLEISKSNTEDVRAHSASYYSWMINHGVAKECARVILPEGLTMSRLAVNATLRSWLHYVEVRDDPGVTQHEHVVLARKIKAVLEPVFPTVFGAINADKS